MRVRISSRIWLLAIFLFAFALRLYRLGVASLWYDETVSLFLARQNLVDLTRHTAGDIHPPLYYYLLHFWGRVAGWSEFSVAFVSLFFGAVLAALVYRVAREWFSRQVAVIAVFLVSISPYNLWYSQEVRMYTLGATLGLASVYFFVRMLRVQTADNRRPTKIISRDFIAYVVLGALGLYTLYYFAFLLVFENLAALIWLIRKSQIAEPVLTRAKDRKSRSRIWDLGHLHSLRDLRSLQSPSGLRAVQVFGIWVLSQLSIFLLYLPWLPIAFRQATDPPVPPWRSFIPLPNVLLESFSALALGQSVDTMMVLPILLIAAALIVIALVRDGRGQTTGGSPQIVGGFFLLAYTFVPLLIIYLLSFWKPLYHVRYIFTYSPAFYILMAVGLERLRNTQYAPRTTLYVSHFTLLLLTAASAYSAHNFWFDPRFAHDDLRGAVQRIAEKWRPGDVVLINAGYAYTAFDYYFDQPIVWRGRLTEYPSLNSSLGTTQRTNDLHAGPIVLQTGSIAGSPNLGWGSSESDFYATSAEETRAVLDRVFAVHPRVWMLRLYDTVIDPEGIVREYLAQRGRIIDDQVFTGESNARVQGYLTTREPMKTFPVSATRREIILGGKIVLVGFEPEGITTRAGEAVDVNLYWRAMQPMNVDGKVFVGLFAANGQLVASVEDAPLGNALGTSRWSADEIMREPIRLVIPKSVARGEYGLRVAMFDPFTREPLAGEKSEWVVDGSQIMVTRVKIQ